MHLENISVIGYLGQDPTSNVVNGKSVCNFNIAATNPRNKKVTWYRAAVWGANGDACMKFLSKGKAVFVQGQLEIKDWQRSTGMPEKQFEIQANTVQFLSGQEKAEKAPFDPGYGNYDPNEVPF